MGLEYMWTRKLQNIISVRYVLRGLLALIGQNTLICLGLSSTMHSVPENIRNTYYNHEGLGAIPRGLFLCSGGTQYEIRNFRMRCLRLGTPGGGVYHLG